MSEHLRASDHNGIRVAADRDDPVRVVVLTNKTHPDFL